MPANKDFEKELQEAIASISVDDVARLKEAFNQTYESNTQLDAIKRALYTALNQHNNISPQAPPVLTFFESKIEISKAYEPLKKIYQPDPEPFESIAENLQTENFRSALTGEIGQPATSLFYEQLQSIRDDEGLDDAGKHEAMKTSLGQILKGKKLLEELEQGHQEQKAIDPDNNPGPS